MEPAKRNLVIVEFYSWHDECLHSLCLLFKRMGYNVTLALNSKLEKRIGSSMDHVAAQIVYFPFGSGLKGLIALGKFYRFLLQTADALHINTAQGRCAWKFFLFPIPKRIEVTGTLHYTEKLRQSLGQRIITRHIGGYMLLSDLLLKRYAALTTKPETVVYPIFYPTYPSVHIEKKKEEVWIVIPGSVALNRRDYHLLLPESNKQYAKHVKFVILGNIQKDDGSFILQKIKERNLEDNFILFNQFVKEDVFYSYVKACDYILPLVDTEQPVYAKYINNKISGSYNLAFAFRKPMLCPIGMSIYEDFSDTSLFYTKAGFVEFINNLKPSPDISALYRLSKWKITEQEKRLATLYKKTVF